MRFCRCVFEKSKEMNLVSICLVSVFVVNIDKNDATQCGCKVLNKCYKNMLSTLLDKDEAECIEDAEIGASTLTIFLKAINEFCGKVMKLSSEHMTYEGRNLYEVVLSKDDSSQDHMKPPKPVFIIEAGQEGGSQSVGLALYLVEQLVACKDYDEMLERVTWVVLPSSNPDGQEFSRYAQMVWKKNVKPSADHSSYGVDVSRNFDVQFTSCPKIESGFSPIFPGPFPTSENETIFIKSVIDKYKKDAKVYVSIREDGHSINSPYGYLKDSPPNSEKLHQVAGDVAARVNLRAGSLNSFENKSLFDVEGKRRCGHSVDYAYETGIPLSYEMRVFPKSEAKIMSKFLSMPRGYDTTLRNGYFSGIRELYKILTTEKKHSPME